MAEEKSNAGKLLLTAATAGSVAAIVSNLLSKKPVAAAPDDEKWEYLFELQQAIIGLLGQLLEKPIEVSVSNLWVAKTPEHIFDQAIRSVGTLESDQMVDYRNSKRLIIKVENTLDQAVNVQPVGDITNSFALAVNVGPALPCVANGNISVGLAWDDWHPYIGVRVTTAVAPTAGKLDIWTVMQE